LNGFEEKMKKITKKWLEFADNDLQSAKVLLGSKAHENAIWHCHQAVEKTIKAIVIEKGIRLRKTHDLIGLVNDAKIDLSKSLSEFIDDLNPYYNPIRYPDAALESKLSYNRQTTQIIFQKSKEVIQWLKTLIQ